MNNKKVQPNSPRTSYNFDSTYCDDCVTKGGLDQSQGSYLEAVRVPSAPHFTQMCVALCRKAYLLEDKQIPSVGVFDEVWLLEEMHVTWAHLEKKRTRLRLYTKSLEEIRIQIVETVSRFLVTASDHIRDGVRIFKTASESRRLKRNP
ncbi:hypothetical protein Tco_0303960 [Tanacetum coccineum]